MKHFLNIISAVLLLSCAQTSPLSGGAKDTYAPSIDSAKTTPFIGQTNFADDRVSIRFNEYIKLNNPNDNILITPALSAKPEIEAKNKRLTILFKEPLAQNTTYTITFNNAVQDITESNDSVFQFVFSTGDYIDSLSITGKVKDAFTNQPEKSMLVALYPKDLEANFDSIPLKFKPTYLSQADAGGRFEISYLKQGVFYIFAFGDRNKNLLYDQGEPIAFIEEKEFNLTADVIHDFELRSFTEKSEDIFLEDLEFIYPGKVQVILSNPTDSFLITSNIPLLKEPTERNDSLIFWLEQKPVPKMRFYTELLGQKDTIKPVYGKIPEKEEEVKLLFIHNIQKGNLLPAEDLKFTFSEPVAGIDLERIHFFDVDSNEVRIERSSIDLREVTFATYGTSAQRIVIDSAAVRSIYDHETKEKIDLSFVNHEDDYYGSLILSMDTTFSVPVVIHLINEKGLLIDSAAFQNKVTFTKLLPGNYQLRLIFDVDGDGNWTSGSLREGRIPEGVIYDTEIIKVKSKWEKEVEWILNNN